VSNELSEGASEVSKSEGAASDACTRAGLFALLLAIVIGALASLQAKRPSDNALLNYLNYRYMLSADVEHLDHDPLWVRYRKNHDLKDSAALFALMQPVPDFLLGSGETLESPAPAIPPPPSPVPHNPPKQSKDKTGHHEFTLAAPTFGPAPRPAAQHGSNTRADPSGKHQSKPFVLQGPTSFQAHIVTQIPDILAITDILKRLNDESLLAKSKEYSTYFAFSIGLWNLRRHTLFMDNYQSSRCAVDANSIHLVAKPVAEVTFRFDDDSMLKCLTLADVRALAAFQMPEITNPDQIGDHISRNLDFGPGELPRNARDAGWAVSAMFIVVLMYFLAYAKEAAKSPAFPSAGTLFSAFSQTRLLTALFSVALATPMLTSFWLAMESRTVVQWIAAALVCIVTSAIFVTLYSRVSKRVLRRSAGGEAPHPPTPTAEHSPPPCAGASVPGAPS
jgi:hypothetical protein